MKKQIKDSINELYIEQLRQQSSTKRIKQRKKLPIMITLFVTTAVVMFTVILLPKVPNSLNEEAINNNVYLDTNITQDGTQDFKVEKSTIKSNQTVTIYDEKDIQYVEEVFRLAKQIPGIANISTPQYKVQLGAESELFFLWFNEDHSATLMKSPDTYTIFKIRSAEKIEEIVKENVVFKQLMDGVEWKTGMVSMMRPFDLTFIYESTHYQLWLNEEEQIATLVPVEKNVNRWASLNKKDSATLMMLLETSSNSELTLQKIEEIESLLGDVKWEMIHEPDYKIKNFLFWIAPSNDQLEVIQLQGGYAKLSKEKSTLIFNIISPS